MSSRATNGNEFDLHLPTRRGRVRFAAGTGLLLLLIAAGVGLMLAYFADLYG